uniref:Immunoglobulin V-set domain-containing protein n=1 Tax=Dicentrarchus labrax TaxID=13489 RepID=A0A8P4GB90_DICLA
TSFLTKYSLVLIHRFVSCVSGVHCGEFKVTMPQTIEVLSGSCVTIPCSFDIEDRFGSDLDRTSLAVSYGLSTILLSVC